MNWHPKYSAIDETAPDLVDERDAEGGEQITYVGFCSENTEGTGTNHWRILRYRTTVNNGAVITERMFADGSVYFNKIWNERDNYSYRFRI